MMKRLFLLLIISIYGLYAAAAQVDTIEIYSAVMKKRLKCVVVVPEAYSGGQRFPVVYLLHGYSGNYANWIQNAPALADDADRYQMILVCPYGGYNSWYLDSRADKNSMFKTYVGKEVPAYIDSAYMTIADKKSRAITGLSMGGHGALYLALQFSETFGAAGSMSGGVDLVPWKSKFGLPEVLGDTSKVTEYHENSIVKLVTNEGMILPAMIIDCGIDDFFLRDNRKLHQALLNEKIPHDYIERPGSHNFAYWRNAVKYQLLFFHNYFREMN